MVGLYILIIICAELFQEIYVMILWLQILDFKSLSSVMLLDTIVINLNRSLTCTRVYNFIDKAWEIRKTSLYVSNT